MCDNAVDPYFSTIEYVLDVFKTQEMCDKSADKSPFVFDSVPGQYKIQECVIKLFLMILFDKFCPKIYILENI